MLQQLIELPSVSSTQESIDQSNLPVIERLAQWLGDLGFDTEILHIKTTPGRPAKANLIATLGAGPGGLVLSGHTDTVPFDDHLWSVNPLALTQKDNRLYGLGSTDMKGFFPIAIEAARAFKDENLKAPLIILATADEESSMSGAEDLVRMGRPKARCAIIGEPTGLKPIRCHKGMMMESITITGQAGHSSDPSLGNNAMEAMFVVAADLAKFRAELQAKYQNPLFSTPVPTINFGCIHGGDNPNRICGSCEMQFDIRPLPGMVNDEIRAAIRKRLAPLAQQLQINIELKSLFAGIPAFESPADSDLVKACEKLTGHAASAVSFGTEAPFLQALGMDTIIMGPGSIDQAHQPDEYMSLDQVQPTIDVLKQLIAKFCT
ncbi:MAG: acetylornithine deacetylase [Pseudomonadales bacterium]|nr:acetylornithine deacetylase [Pseudomonadales bacterium]